MVNTKSVVAEIMFSFQTFCVQQIGCQIFLSMIIQKVKLESRDKQV